MKIIYKVRVFSCFQMCIYQRVNCCVHWNLPRKSRPSTQWFRFRWASCVRSWPVGVYWKALGTDEDMADCALVVGSDAVHFRSLDHHREPRPGFRDSLIIYSKKNPGRIYFSLLIITYYYLFIFSVWIIPKKLASLSYKQSGQWLQPKSMKLACWVTHGRLRPLVQVFFAAVFSIAFSCALKAYMSDIRVSFPSVIRAEKDT